MSNQNVEQKQAPWAIIAIIVVIIFSVVIYFSFFENNSEQQVEAPPIVVSEPVVEPVAIIPPTIDESDEIIEEPVLEDLTAQVEEESIEPEVVLPTLDESDSWFTDKLPNLTWRKELLKLMITEDMIRRFVVFTDNFSQGTLAYEHSPLTAPASKFSAIEVKDQSTPMWQWDEGATRRFSLYVDLLRSIDNELLIQWYVELKPLIDQAYQELGYPDDEFTEVLQSAITKVLDMEIPRETPELVRPSVMFKYKDQALEDLDDAEKLLLRLGKDNLLVVKSILLEINEKLARVE